jgi:uncharacterized phage protein (TIGR02218 family)
MRTVPAALATHLQGVSTTTTRLLKVTLKSGVSYGLCMTDRTLVYDDGAGEVDYVATNGFDPSTLSADLGYSVDNAEGFALISDVVAGVTVEMVERGELDDATWIMYLVNFEDLTPGRHVLLDAGDLGEVRAKHGMVWIPELLSYGMRLRQPIGGVWSRTCRAIFGSPAAAQKGCGIDADVLWVAGSVVSVGAETDRVFTGDNGPTLHTPVPGRVRWTYGSNSGREYGVESVAGAVIELTEPTTYPIDIGDEYEIRPDCGKQYQRDCIDIWDNGINFKGEPLIPVGDAASNQVPGAQLPGQGGWLGDAITAAMEDAEDSP